MLTIAASILTATITAKIVANYYFKKIDGYIEEMCEMTIQNNKHTLAILHELQQTCGRSERRKET